MIVYTCVVLTVAVSGRLLSSVLCQHVSVDGLVQSHAARQDLGQLALRYVQTSRAQILRDVHHPYDPHQQHGSRMYPQRFITTTLSQSEEQNQT